MTRLARVFACALGMLVLPQAVARSVVDSAHNLSPTGPGTIRAAENSAVCEFCHTPHRATPQTALWNRRSPGTIYAPYTSSTALADAGQPTGTSLMCLSCHDGTVALGDVLSRPAPIAMAGGSGVMPPGRGFLGTDLRHHHPVSFVFDSRLVARKGELAMPTTLPKEIRLDGAGQMQCTTCHDAHDDSNGDFLVMPNQGSSLCVACHRKDDWTASSHAQSGATWNGQGRNPWPDSKDKTVAGNACRNCHETHQAGGGPQLLRHAAEEDNCAACHNGNVAGKDVMASFEQFSAHPVQDASQAHQAGESAVVMDRHVECVDCHEPHRTSAGGAGAALPGAPRSPPTARGVDLNNGEVKRASRGYEVCLRCHGDSPRKGIPRVRRQLDQNNVRLEIQPGNPSFHPIAGPGRNQDVPSLIAPWTEQSIMDCIDCHNSSAAASVGGGGPEGPHASSIEPILARRYVTTDNTPESAANYALCYSCHSRDSILADESFRGHRQHVVDGNTPCSTCHDPHGVSATQGNDSNNGYLINFDTTVVTPNAQGLLRYVDQGRYRGTCDLACHGKNHQSEGY